MRAEVVIARTFDEYRRCGRTVDTNLRTQSCSPTSVRNYNHAYVRAANEQNFVLVTYAPR